MINGLRVDIMKYDSKTLIAMREANSIDFKVWCGDIIQYFYYKMLAGEALPMVAVKHAM